MTQCVQRSVTQCLKRKLPLVSSQPRRLFSQGDAVNQDSPLSSSLVDLKAIHEKWKSAGFFPRAPAHVMSQGAKCLNTLLHHNKVTNHLFNGQHYKLFPLLAHFNGRVADFGGILSPKQALIAPEVSWDAENLNNDKKYTLMMVSPDCSSCGIQWCVRNIPPTLTPLTSDVINTTGPSTLVDYVPPVPLKGTGFYRYVILLLEQDAAAPPDTVTYSDILPDLISQHSLVPVGVAMFQACWDSSVGHSLATHIRSDEKQFVVQRTKDNHEHRAEQLFLRKEWEMKTGFM